WKLNGEGFFIAVFRKKETESHVQNRDIKPKYKQMPIADKWKPYLNKEVEYHLGGAYYFAFNIGQLGIYNFLKDKLRIKKAGIRLGKIAQSDIIPEHEL